MPLPDRHLVGGRKNDIINQIIMSLWLSRDVSTGCVHTIRPFWLPALSDVQLANSIFVPIQSITMPICAITGCSNRPGRIDKVSGCANLSFFKIPTIISNQGDATRELSAERRRLWKAAVNRKDPKTEEEWDKTIVCSIHFVDGVKAYLHLRNSPSWLPTLHLGYQDHRTASPGDKDKFKRLQTRKRRAAASATVFSSTSPRKARCVGTCDTDSAEENVQVSFQDGKQQRETGAASDELRMDRGLNGGQVKRERGRNGDQVEEGRLENGGAVQRWEHCGELEIKRERVDNDGEVERGTWGNGGEIETDRGGNDYEHVVVKRERGESGDEVERETVGSVPSADAEPRIDTSVQVQTDLTKQELQRILEDYNARVAEAVQRRNIVSIYDMVCYERDDSKVSFYTGLPSFSVLKTVFGLVSPHMSATTVSLNKEQQVLLCLVKLKMNYQFQDIAYNLNVSFSTVQRSFHRTLELLVSKLSFLLQWPEREELRVSMPMCFRELFGDKVALVVDCFELKAEKPSASSGAANHVQVHSNDKHNHILKFLIGITPQGTVHFISQSSGDRTSDQHVIEGSGILHSLLPGDILITGRGFTSEGEVMFYQANCTHGKKQLHPLDVENTKQIAPVRIHVGRIIRCIRRKFAILQSTVPIEYMRKKIDSADPTIDQIVKLCCCLLNLHKSLVPFD